MDEERSLIFAEVLIDYPLEEIKTALRQIILTARRDFVPADVLNLLKPKESTKRETAVDAMTLIRQAVSRHGWAWTEGIYENGARAFYGVRAGVKQKFEDWESAAKFELGDLALETMRRKFGAWSSMCENLRAIDANVDAQTREVAEMVVGKAERNEMHDLPVLPNQELKNLLGSFGSLK